MPLRHGLRWRPFQLRLTAPSPPCVVAVSSCSMTPISTLKQTSTSLRPVRFQLATPLTQVQHGLLKFRRGLRRRHRLRFGRAAVQPGYGCNCLGRHRSKDRRSRPTRVGPYPGLRDVSSASQEPVSGSGWVSVKTCSDEKPDPIIAPVV